MVNIQLYTAWLYWKKVVWGLRQNSEKHKLERKQNKQILQGDEYMILFYFIAIIIISLVCDILSVNLEFTFWLDCMVWHPFPFCPQCCVFRHAQCLTQVVQVQTQVHLLLHHACYPLNCLCISITSNLSKERKRDGENIGYNICMQKEKKIDSIVEKETLGSSSVSNPCGRQ